jgi:hypothetical protein
MDPNQIYTMIFIILIYTLPSLAVVLALDGIKKLQRHFREQKKSAVTEKRVRCIRWLDDEGRPHREDGPAFLSVDGTERWYIHGKLHRADGPATTLSQGTQKWFHNGKLHREDGPAIIYGPAFARRPGVKKWFYNGQIHRVDGPAVEYPNGDKEYWQHDHLHRDNGPAIDKNTIKAWLIKGKLHSHNDKPALIVKARPNKKHYRNLYLCFNFAKKSAFLLPDFRAGDTAWWKNGKLHRENGPAIVTENGTKKWYKNGLPHRENGPAVEYPNGSKEWWLNGRLHREDGPAVEVAKGYFLFSKNKKRITQLPLKNGSIWEKRHEFIKRTMVEEVPLSRMDEKVIRNDPKGKDYKPKYTTYEFYPYKGHGQRFTNNEWWERGTFIRDYQD